MSHVTVTVSFNTEKHAALLAWLDRQHNRSEAIRRACEAAYEHDGAVTLLDVMLAIEDLKRAGVVVRGDDAQGDGDEPAEAVLALDKLGR